MRTLAILGILLAMISLSLPACDSMHAEEKTHEEQHHIVVTCPVEKEVIITQRYVCQIHSRKHIEVKAFEEGYLEEITVKEGQQVHKGDVLFKIYPPLFQARLKAAEAEVQFAQVELDNTNKLFKSTPPVVSIQEVKLYEAKLEKAKAELQQAQAELNFTTITAQFDGIIDRLYQQEGSLVKEDDLLTTLSDNSLMWVYFPVPEARYLEYKARQGKSADISRLKLEDSDIELMLANGSVFSQTAGHTVTIEGQFNNETGTIPFRADFPNPDHLLRHGQTGTVLVHHKLHNTIVIPQRATFEILDQRYVWVIDEDHVVHQRPIVIEHELEDIFVIKSGLALTDKIILEGVRQVHDGEKVEYEFQQPEKALTHQKYHAE